MWNAQPQQVRNPLSDAVRRAATYLADEVPRWSEENHCFSCHNNGDGARALFVAREIGHAVPPAALADTLQWLRHPGRWDDNRGNPAFSDKKLARIQFAASLLAASEAGLIGEKRPLIEAAESLLPYQEPEGFWKVDAEGSVGSPTTWGSHLATHSVRRLLVATEDERFRAPASRAAMWLSKAALRTVVDAAATIMAFADPRFRHGDSPDTQAKLQQAIRLVLEAQASDGGWGPYPKSPSEPFDTAVVLLALTLLHETQFEEPMARGRAYLLEIQLPSGGWPETTRPSGAQSYAQHISTSAWATLALLAGPVDGDSTRRQAERMSPGEGPAVLLLHRLPRNPAS